MRVRLSLIPLVLFLSLGALIAACSGGEDESDGGPASDTTVPPVSGTSTPSGSTIASPVGDAVVSLPPGSDITGGSVEISTLPAAQWPPELSVVEARLVVQIGPDGARFDEPVTVTLNLAAVELTDVSDVFLITRNPDGSWESLADITTEMDGTAVLVSGTTTHFSPFAAGIQAAGTVAHEGVSVAGAENSESPAASGEQVQTLPALTASHPQPSRCLRMSYRASSRCRTRSTTRIHRSSSITPNRALRETEFLLCTRGPHSISMRLNRSSIPAFMKAR